MRMTIQFPPSDPDLIHAARDNMIFKIHSGDAGRRLDDFTAAAVGLSVRKIRELIDFGSVWVCGKVCGACSRILEENDWVTFQAPAYGPVRFYEIDPSRIIIEDGWLLAYDKEAGIPCHQTPYDGYNHIYGGLQRHLKKKAHGSDYLAMHHRLDGPTSGLLVFSMRKEANAGLGSMFSSGGMSKTYLAAVSGIPQREEWVVDRPIAKRKGGFYCPEDEPGKEAKTIFRVLAKGEKKTLIEARPVTGRTHQIRLHLQVSGFPIIGDATYGGAEYERMMLHAFSLEFKHPKDGRVIKLETQTPDGFFAD